MEGFGLFNLAGTGGDATMRTAVHTRRIVDPLAGVKLTGTAGQVHVRHAGRARCLGGDRAHKFSRVGRAVRNFGDAQYVGALVTDTEFRVGSQPCGRRGHLTEARQELPLERQLHRDAVFDALGERSDGLGGQLSYSYDTRRYNVAGQVEHFDPGFRMDTAFVQRVGITRAWQYQALSFYPEGAFRLDPACQSLHLDGGRRRPDARRRRVLLPAGAAVQLHPLRVPARRQGDGARDVRAPALHHRPRAGGRRRTVDQVAEPWRHLQSRPGGLLRPGRAVPGPSARAERARGPAAEHAAEQPDQLHVRALRARDDAATPSTTCTSSTCATRISSTSSSWCAPSRSTTARGAACWATSWRRTSSSPGTVVHAGYGSLWERLEYNPYQTTARAFFFKASYLAHF